MIALIGPGAVSWRTVCGHAASPVGRWKLTVSDTRDPNQVRVDMVLRMACPECGVDAVLWCDAPRVATIRGLADGAA